MARTPLNLNTNSNSLPLVPIKYVSDSPADVPNGIGVVSPESFLSKTGPSFPAGDEEYAGPNILRTFGNIPSSARDLAKAVISPVNPADTESPMNIGKNIAESAVATKDIFSEQGAGEGIKNIASGFFDTAKKIFEAPGKAYMNYIQKTGYADNPDTQHLFETTILKPLRAIAKIGIEDPFLIPSLLYTPGKLTKGSDLIGDIGGLVTGGADTSLKNVGPILKNVAGDAAGAVLDKTGAVIKKSTSIIGVTPESLIANVNRINSTKRIEFESQQGVTPEKWLNDKGIIGTRQETVTELAKRFQSLQNEVDTGLEKIPGNFRDSRITVVAEDAKNFAVNTESPQSSRMSELADKANGVGLSTTEINEVKRFYEKNVKFNYMQDVTKSSEQVALATNRDSGIRQAILDIADKGGFPNLGEISKEIQATKFLADEITGKITGQAANNPMGLTDWITLSGAAVNPNFIAAFIGKKILSTETVRAFAAKTLSGFPKVKSIPIADMDTIISRAKILAKKESVMAKATQESAILYDELKKIGITSGEGWISKSADDILITNQEKQMLRAAKKAEFDKTVQFILEQKAIGNAVGEGFIIKNWDNIPILNPQARFDVKNSKSLTKTSD